MKAASDTPAGSITENIPPRKPAIKIGELLISEGFVTNADINRALAVQQEEKVFTKKPLGEIFVQMGFITEQDLDAAINHPTLRKNIGSLAIDQGLITKEDLELCLKNKKSGQLIGELLVDFGLLTRNDIGDLLQKQINSPKLGQVLMDLKLITEKELQSALRKQKSTRALGEILCDLKLVTPQDLNYVLEKYGKQVELAEVLIKLGFINENTLAEAKKIQAATSEALDFILLKNKFISSEQLQTALAKKHNLPFMHLQDFAFSEKNKTELTSLLTQKYAEKNLILPISLLTNSLTIAIYRPDQLIYVNELKSLYPQLTINPAIITEEKFEELFEILYSKKLSAEALSQDEGADDGEIEAPQEEIDFMEIDLDENFDDSQEQAPVYGQQDLEAEELVNFIVKYGILNSASDIHIEQDRQGIKLRYRIDGILQESNVNWLKHKMKDKVGAIVSRIKVMSNLDIAEKRMPQDGVFRINYYDKANNQKFD
ncbi:MAG: Flp pilus assembly complex ATPase component, partial [Deltaproteobacteria bacterium]|nr:Flp pilus assembly complex ATPase component [Deltaproteobacteria bacterium]